MTTNSPTQTQANQEETPPVKSTDVTNERHNKGLGWRPDIPDIRDFRFSAVRVDGAAALPAILPTKAEARRFRDHPIFDQREIGSCTGQSVARMFAIARKVTPRSPLFIYYEARRIINETDQDNGAYIRDAVKVANALGVPRDDLWPDVDDNVFLDPVEKADRDAEKRKVGVYYRLSSAYAMRQCIAAGYPFVIGISCYDSLFGNLTMRTGYVPLPNPVSEVLWGGHAVCIGAYDFDFKSSKWADDLHAAGYADDQIPDAVFIGANSWGSDWGRNGYFAIDASFLGNTDLADDCWTVRAK